MKGVFMNYIKKIRETLGLCLLDIKEESEKKEILNLLLRSDNRLDVLEVYMSYSFIANNLNLLTEDQKNKFDHILVSMMESLKKLHIMPSSEPTDKPSTPKEKDFEVYLKTLDRENILNKFKDTVYEIYIGDEKMVFEVEKVSDEKKIESYFSNQYSLEDDEDEVFKKLIKTLKDEGYFKEEYLNDVKNIKNLKTNEIVHLLNLSSAISSYNRRNLLLNFAEEKKKKLEDEEIQKVCSFLESVDNSKDKIWLKTNPSLILDATKDDIVIYNLYKIKVKRDITGLIDDLSVAEIIFNLSKKNKNLFTKDDVIKEIKNNKTYQKSLKNLKDFFKEKIQIEKDEGLVIPYIGNGSFDIDELLENGIQEEINHMVLNKGNYAVLMKDVDKNDDLSKYTCDQIHDDLKRKDNLIDILSREFFKHVDENKINNKNFARQILECFRKEVCHIQQIKINTIENLEVLRKNLVSELREMKEKPKKIPQHIHEIVSVKELLKTEGIEKLKEYWESLYKIEKPNERALSLMLMFHIGKDIFKWDVEKELQNHELKKSLVSYSDKVNVLFDFHFIHQNNVGRLLKLEKELDAPVFSNFVQNLLDIKNRETIALGTSHDGRANRLGYIIRQNNYQGYLMDYVFKKSTDILKSVFDEVPEEILTISSVAPIEKYKRKNIEISYFDEVLKKVTEDPKYAKKWDEISFEKNIISSRLSDQLSHRVIVEPESLFKLMDRYIKNNKKEDKDNLLKISEILNFFEEKKNAPKVYWEEALSELIKSKEKITLKDRTQKKNMDNYILKEKYVLALNKSEKMEEYKKIIREIKLMNEMESIKKGKVKSVKKKI